MCASSPPPTAISAPSPREAGSARISGGELWHGFSEQQRSKEEQSKILGQMGFKRPEVLADNYENLQRLQLAGGFNPQQLQQISERYPAAATGSYNPSLAKLISAYNLAGENALAFLDKLNTEAGGNLGVAMQSLPAPDMKLTDEEWRASIDRIYPKTAQWARGLNMYAGQNAQPTMPNASGEYWGASRGLTPHFLPTV